MGASLKGMGAAGIAIEDELSRTAALIDEARKLRIKVIGAHIEGMKRRAQGADAGDTTDEQSIDAVAPELGHPPRLQGRQLGRPLHGHRQGQEDPPDRVREDSSTWSRRARSSSSEEQPAA